MNDALSTNSWKIITKAELENIALDNLVMGDWGACPPVRSLRM